MRMETWSGDQQPLTVISGTLDIIWINLLFVVILKCCFKILLLVSPIIFFRYFPQMLSRYKRTEIIITIIAYFYQEIILLSSDPCHSIIGHFFFSSVTNWFKTLEFTTWVLKCISRIPCGMVCFSTSDTHQVVKSKQKWLWQEQ